jgi:hypothetical protein
MNLWPPVPSGATGETSTMIRSVLLTVSITSDIEPVIHLIGINPEVVVTFGYWTKVEIAVGICGHCANPRQIFNVYRETILVQRQLCIGDAN